MYTVNEKFHLNLSLEERKRYIRSMSFKQFISEDSCKNLLSEIDLLLEKINKNPEEPK